MERERWLAERQERWSRLDALARRGSRRVDRLNAEELVELSRLYRLTAADLAVARRDFPSDRITIYLNGLLARVHPIVYQQRTFAFRRLVEFFRYGFPAEYRASGLYMAVAAALFCGSAIIAYLLVSIDPPTVSLFAGDVSDLRAVLSHHHLWVQSATSNHSVAQSFITTNNIGVAFAAFAGGMLFGVGAIYVLVLNGCMLGAVGALVAQYGLSLAFWAFVLPHGALELSVIVIAGGAGLAIGDALLRPGLQTRGTALRAAARRAAHLLFGCVPLLVIAGTIEANFSPSPVPDVLKLLVGIVLAVALYSYLFRSRPKQRESTYTFADRAG